MRKISKDELEEILEKHRKWLNNKDGGEQADLRSAVLNNANLQCTDLRCADLRCADLRCADLSGANLQYAGLNNANLQYADLRCADLSEANLSDANLQDADLFYSNLKGAERPWFVYMGSIGSRRAETLYFADYDIVHCGCWNDYKGGTLAEFEARVDETYPADIKNEEYQRYRTEYLLAIHMFKYMRKTYIKSLERKKL